MSHAELLETAEAIAGLMPRLARGLTSSEKDPAANLPLAQLRLCGTLSEGPLTMSAVSRALGMSLSALTQIADRLERVGLVKRMAEGSDRRVRCLQLTARGEKMMRKRREARVLRTLAVLEHLTAEQREAIRASMDILVTACSAVQAGAEKVNDQTKTANGHANNHRPGNTASRNSAGKGTKSRVTPQE